MRKYFLILSLALLIFVVPQKIFSAEVLQVRDATTLIIGDQNRNYTIRLACLEVEQSNQENAINYINKILPRHSKVNLKPKGAIDGTLISKVIKIESGVDIGGGLISEGYGSYNC